jgi:hypothetical protein
MCGKAIEAICWHKTGAKTTLADGLKSLRDAKIIDELLFSWGDLLRRERNIGAHANENSTSKRDAEDVLEFTHAICEYIYLLSDKYRQFLARENKRRKRTAAA